ncbi:MAG: D-alanine--D-alanine ligase [Phycisphaeraceae bacterium]
MKILVLKGGPDRERGVSLKSGAAVAAALREAGHEVVEADITPDDLSALDESCDVVFPVLHGNWGEGGPLQRLLEERGLRYVGCGPEAAARAMDKGEAKRAAAAAGVPTPAYEQLEVGKSMTLAPPLVLKPTAEGSSFGVAICQTAEEVERTRTEMQKQFPVVLAEQFVKGRELTIGIVDQQLLPAIEIVPAEGFYDYRAKYEANDTGYRFDVDLLAAVLERMGRDALAVFNEIGCRHLGRVDFIVDDAGGHWFLEINTLPGFTDHSLLPLAAKQAGMAMPELCDRLIRLALQG